MFKKLCHRISVVLLITGCCSLLPACTKKTEFAGTSAANDPEVLALTRQVRRFSMENRRLPQDLEDLTAVGYIKSAPAAAAGRKCGIDFCRDEVVLLNQ